MSRSGYTDDYEGDTPLNFYRQAVANAFSGRRGQAFLRELLAALDAMPVKELVPDELATPNGQFCTLGVIGAARGLDMSREKIDVEDADAVAQMFGIARSMAAEIEFENDDDFCNHGPDETPARRWQRMRDWIALQIREPA